MWIIVGVGLGAYLLYRIRAVVAPLLFAGLIAYVVNPLVTCLEKREVPRSVAILVVYLLIAAGAIIMGLLVVPPLGREIVDAVEFLPRRTLGLQNATRDLLDGLSSANLPLALRAAIDTGIRRGERLLQIFASRLVDAVFLGMPQLLSIVLSPIIAFYILSDLDRLLEVGKALVPRPHQARAVQLAIELDRVLGGFLRGQVIVSALVGATTALALWLLKVKYALLLGIVVSVFNFVPYFGSILGAVPVLALAAGKSTGTVIWAAVVLVAINQVEASILIPKIMKHQLGLHPLAVILGLLAGAELLGVVGMILAIPAAAMLRVVYSFIAEGLRQGPMS